ncbi:HAD-IIIA family hydrolase [Psychrobacillus vulpis]|uniref:D,D-heptose 1,7-bisphosphate phosphatase n=1 Tax=Psychrobacillus vulpis TaxID=2325572 RepID=A0A544TNL5_9BACI|nr:HAD-IIIA family hydrolase [Psychrobacillus vulpis]TQR19017.1 HAD-IIIA family hydrolase [Psychrobacillus vulpis]
MMNIQAVFIDRDGTIGGTGHFIHPKDFKPYDFSQEAFQLLKEHGIKTIAFTNQHRISRKEASIQEFQEEFNTYGFHDAFICPHSENDNCNCHKPRPGMLLDAARKHNLDLKKCVVIGDVGLTDMLAAHAVGAMKILVLTGWGPSSLTQYREAWKEAQPDFIAENLLEAVQWLLNNHTKMQGGT